MKCANITVVNAVTTVNRHAKIDVNFQKRSRSINCQLKLVHFIKMLNMIGCHRTPKFF